MASESIAHSAAIGSEPTRARGIIVKYSVGEVKDLLDWLWIQKKMPSVQSVQLSKGISNNSYTFLSCQEL